MSKLRSETEHHSVLRLSNDGIHSVGTCLVAWLEIPHSGEALNALSKGKRRNHTHLRAIPGAALSS